MNWSKEEDNYHITYKARLDGVYYELAIYKPIGGDEERYEYWSTKMRQASGIFMTKDELQHFIDSPEEAIMGAFL